jgi:hypothetical protein
MALIDRVIDKTKQGRIAWRPDVMCSSSKGWIAYLRCGTSLEDAVQLRFEEDKELTVYSFQAAEYEQRLDREAGNWSGGHHGRSSIEATVNQLGRLYRAIKASRKYKPEEVAERILKAL